MNSIVTNPSVKIPSIAISLDPKATPIHRPIMQLVDGSAEGDRDHYRWLQSLSKEERKRRAIATKH